jgi:hypothetical protein
MESERAMNTNFKVQSIVVALTHSFSISDSLFSKTFLKVVTSHNHLLSTIPTEIVEACFWEG